MREFRLIQIGATGYINNVFMAVICYYYKIKIIPYKNQLVRF